VAASDNLYHWAKSIPAARVLISQWLQIHFGKGNNIVHIHFSNQLRYNNKTAGGFDRQRMYVPAKRYQNISNNNDGISGIREQTGLELLYIEGGEHLNLRYPTITQE